MKHLTEKQLKNSDKWAEKGLCIFCGSKKLMNEEYDSYHCPKCDYWTENICPDKSCEFCRKRPKYPIKP